MKYYNILNCNNNYFVAGGADQYMFDLSSLLNKHGHHVIPFAPFHKKNKATHWENYFPKTFDFKNIRVIDLPKYFYSFSARSNMEKLLKENNVDLAHLHIYHGSITEAILHPLKKRGIPIVQSLHDYRLACPVNTMVSHDEVCELCHGHNYWRAISKSCNRGSFFRTLSNVMSAYFSKLMGAHDKIDHFIAVSEFMKNKMLKYNIGKDKISTIYNYVEVRQFVPSFIPGKYFLYFGRLEKIKGLLTLIKAMKSNFKYPLYIVGSGELKDVLIEKIKSDKLDHVKMVPFKKGKELSELIKGSLCTILPSEWYENCPLSILESFAYGKAVIGANIGGIPELISDGHDGLLFTPKDNMELAEKIKWISNNEQSASTMGKNGRLKVEVKFNADVHYKKISVVYKNLIK